MSKERDQQKNSNDGENGLQLLAGKEVINIECTGQHTFVLTAGKETTKNPIGKCLLGHCTKNTKTINEFSNDSSVNRNSDSSCKLFSPDCILLVAGRRLHCHKMILFHRSPILREMIESEEYPPCYYNGDQNKIVLLLPSIGYDVAKCLIYFLYTDNIETSNLTLAFFEKLKKGAKYLALPRLKAICQIIIDNLKREMEGYSMEMSSVTETKCIESSISRDFGNCLLDNKWADIKFVTNTSDEIELFAHKLILASRSSYFKNLFSQEESYNSGTAIIIEVPESNSDLFRVLTFLYTGLIVSKSNEELYQDIVLACRYKLDDMKDLCESMIKVTFENVTEILKIIQDTKDTTPRLREEVVRVISSNLSNFQSKDDVKDENMNNITTSAEEILKNYSELLANVLKTKQDGMTSNNKMRLQEKKVISNSTEHKVPMHIEDTTKSEGLSTILYLLASVVAYYFLLRVFVALRPFVPVYVMNIVFLCLCIFLAMNTMDIK